jgi:DNA-binding NarL/FixJ family response regulator
VGTGTADPLRKGVYVIDTSGAVFSRLRKIALGVPLWRASDDDLPPTRARLAVVATSPIDWDRVTTLAAHVPTLVISAHANEEEAQRALVAGAIGHVAASVAPASLRRAIRAALAGEPVFSRRTLVTTLRAQGRAPRSHAGLKLTARQLQVLALIAKGASDKEIGARLGISAATAQKHASSLVKRLGVPNRAAAAARAYVVGIMT